MPLHIPPPLPGCCWLRLRVTRQDLLRGRVSLPPLDGREPPANAALYHLFDVGRGVSLCSRQLLTPEWCVDADPALDGGYPHPAEQCRDCRTLHLDLTGGHPLSGRLPYRLFHWRGEDGVIRSVRPYTNFAAARPPGRTA